MRGRFYRSRQKIKNMINSVKKEVRIGLRKSDEIHWKIEKNASMQKCKYADIEKCFIFYSRLNFLAYFRSTYYGDLFVYFV